MFFFVDPDNRINAGPGIGGRNRPSERLSFRNNRGGYGMATGIADLIRRELEEPPSQIVDHLRDDIELHAKLFEMARSAPMLSRSNEKLSSPETAAAPPTHNIRPEELIAASIWIEPGLPALALTTDSSILRRSAMTMAMIIYSHGKSRRWEMRATSSSAYPPRGSRKISSTPCKSHVSADFAHWGIHPRSRAGTCRSCASCACGRHRPDPSYFRDHEILGHVLLLSSNETYLLPAESAANRQGDVLMSKALPKAVAKAVASYNRPGGRLQHRLRAVISDLPKPMARSAVDHFFPMCWQNSAEGNRFGAIVLAVSWRREAIVERIRLPICSNGAALFHRGRAARNRRRHTASLHAFGTGRRVLRAEWRHISAPSL